MPPAGRSRESAEAAAPARPSSPLRLPCLLGVLAALFLGPRLDFSGIRPPDARRATSASPAAPVSERPVDRPAAGQDQTLDFRSVGSAAEYRTEPPDGPGFLGADAAVLSRALAPINRTLSTSLRPDNRLARLARWIYDHLGPDQDLPGQSGLDLLASRLGLVEPLPHLLVVQAPDAQRLANTVSARLARVLDLADYTHIGGVAEYEADSSVVVIIALSGRHVEMTPVPRRLSAPGSVALAGRLARSYAKPRLAHTRPSGETGLTDLGPGPQFRATVDLAERGRHRLEIEAEGPAGPTVIANFPVYVAVPVEETVVSPAAPKGPIRPDDVRDRLLELIAADRAKAGVGPLVFDPALAEVALRHSRDMQAHGFVAHVSPTTGSVDDRLRAAGIVAPLAAECVGKGYSPEEIHQGFMDSPGHRASTLLAGATHIGIGVAAASEGEREGRRTTYFVTELFIRRIPALGPGAKARLLADLDGRRIKSGAAALEEDAELSRLADEAAREFMENADLSESQVLARLKDRLARLKPGPGSIIAVLTVVDSLEEGVDRAAADGPTGAARRIGLGLAQGGRPGLPPNMIVLVLIYAETPQKSSPNLTNSSWVEGRGPAKPGATRTVCLRYSMVRAASTGPSS